MKKFEIEGYCYDVKKCTAVAYCDMDTMQKQDALLVTTIRNGEKIQHVVFGYDMPETSEEFAEMCEDSTAWESDYEVLKTVRIK